LSDLEQYYNERFYRYDGSITFSKLTEEQKLSIEGSYDFASWRLDRAFQDMKRTIKKAIGVEK